MRRALILPCLLLLACGAQVTPVAAPSHPDLPSTQDLGEGLTVELQEYGTGEPARIGDEVTLSYVVRVESEPEVDETPTALPDASVIGSTEGWDLPCRVRLGERGPARLLPGIERALEGLRAGSLATIRVPPELGYGKEGRPESGIPGEKALLVDVRVLGVQR